MNFVSYTNIIRNLSLAYIDSTDKLIAQEMMKCINNRKFLKQTIFSDICNVSPSVITAFCKRIKVPGYKELVYKLQLETEMMDNFRSNILEIEGNTSRTLESISTLFFEIRPLLNNIINVLNARKEVVIVSTFQTIESCLFLEKLLRQKGIKVNVIDWSLNLNEVTKIVDTPAIYFAFGPDNFRLHNLYNASKENKFNFLFSSSFQVSKLDINEDNSFIVNPETKLNSWMYRKVIMELISILIFEKIL
ncbi:hypothetical protein [Mesoplasma photuris]|uniref:hypothetical protein n=1 Tax=Mesoplasma photuris TaxID=217731 RepID=UPI0004E286CC|nr:hypothetical protein [Mesoplasma photuris]